MKNGLSLLCLALLLTGCATEGPRQLLPESETVMTPGMRVTATNPNGTVTITAGEGTRRHYSGTGWQKSLSLIARSARWNGSLGLYDPASSFSPYGRLLAEEGRIHCTSISEAMRWLYVGSALNHPTYTNNGLVFCYSIAVPPDAAREPARSVELWQLYINGRRPQHLPGANDRAIRVEGGSIPNTSMAYRAPVGYDMLLGDHEYLAH
ncbi:MAG: hypothetical protein QOE70_2753 [Chthoniobacter sp.]|jgi:hypothetical protein|nr:hypothetical protein [Chthoniobacter sp.]